MFSGSGAIRVIVWIMQPRIVTEKLSREELAEILRENFETMVKIDVDIRRGVLAVGGEWHSEGDELLNKDGSSREDVWGINFYPYAKPGKRIEYVSLINIKPAFGHPAMEIADAELRNNIRAVVEQLLLASDEQLDV